MARSSSPATLSRRKFKHKLGLSLVFFINATSMCAVCPSLPAEVCGISRGVGIPHVWEGDSIYIYIYVACVVILALVAV